jgi:flagellar motor switch protein FliN
MDKKIRNDRARDFVSAVANELSGALSQATGDSYSLQVSNIPDPQEKSAPAQFRIKASGNLRGECFIEFYDPLLAQLTAKIPAEGGLGGEDKRETIPAAIDSAMLKLAGSLAPQYGSVEFAVDAVSGLAFGGMWMAPLATAENPSNSTVLVYLDGGLLDSLSGEGAPGTGSEGEPNSIHPANLKLVMDVELNVSLRFGQRRMPLREVLELASGSVVELDRMVDEPVELFLDGKLVARGEAVIVDGNYGLRVTEIPQSVQSHFLN